jgi:fatty acid desaturase
MTRISAEGMTPFDARDASATATRQITDLVKDLIAPRAAIYWFDLLATFVIGQIGLLFYLNSPLWSAEFFLGFFTAGFAFYRGIVFAHEIAHFRAGTFRGFRIAWNALFGIPFMFPSFLYDDHKVHHVNHSYGTADDAEYTAFGRGTLAEIIEYLARVLLVPIVAVGRFMVLAPLAWCFPRLRGWVWSLTSPIVALNLRYRRHLPDDAATLRVWRGLEFACFAYGAVIFTLMFAGLLPWTFLLYMYCLFVFVSGVNYLRALGAHRYLSDGAPSTYIEQLLDSYTIDGPTWFGPLWAPLGMRYHALHHLMPSMPYHNLRAAHERLLRELPADSPYRATIRTSLWQALYEVASHARRSRHAAPSPGSA